MKTLPDSTRARTAAVAAVVALTTIYRLWLFEHIASRSFFAKYWYFAGRILEGRLAGTGLGDISIGYVFLIAACRSMGLTVSQVLIAQVLLLMVSAIAVGMAGTWLFGLEAGLGAAILMLGSRAAFVNATDLEPETVLLTLVSVGLATLALALRDDGRARWFAATGLAFGFAALMRPVPLLMAAAIVLWLVLRSMRRRTTRERADWKAIVVVSIAIAIPTIAGGIVLRFVAHRSTTMDPATVFYEGMNPSADGYSGVQPAIVRELQRHFDEPDSMHLTYRVVARRAESADLSPAQANLFWLRKSLAFGANYPAHALALEWRKVVLTLNAYDDWDLQGMFVRASEVGPVWIPFSVVAPLALAGLVLAHRQRLPYAWLITLLTVASGIHLIVFYVTSRQRNTLLPAFAIAAGIAIRHAIRHRERTLRFVLGAAIVLAAMFAFSIPGVAQLEQSHIWQNYLEGSRLVEAADHLGHGPVRNEFLADARVRGFGTPVTAGELRRFCVAALPNATDPARRFDLAVALQSVDEWRISGRIAQELARQAYEPRRGSRTTNSVAYLRFRSLVHLGGSGNTIRDLLKSAAREAPGDPWVLAAESVFEVSRSAGKRLRVLHDPFTSELALAQAQWDAGNANEALFLVRKVRTAVPEWDRAREFEALLENSLKRVQAIRPIRLRSDARPSASFVSSPSRGAVLRSVSTWLL